MRFSFVWVILTVGFLALSCGKDPDLVSNQASSFANFFKTNSLDSLVQEGVYVHIGNRSRAGRDAEPIVERGDSLKLLYQASTYYYGANVDYLYNPYYVFATNKRWLASSIPDFNLSQLNFDTLCVKLGSSQMIDGLVRGLPNSRRGDSILLFLTSDLAFGEKSAGVITANTPVVYIVNIEKVKKQQ